jgi:CTP:molybdopterin cytidylyltransferase MocA
VSAGRVAGLLLAAGSGSRFGGPKALVPWDGELLVHRAARTLREGGCDPVVLVVGARGDEVRAAAGLPDVVVSEDWASGMGASLRAGLDGLPVDAGACVVGLVDQPLLGSAAVARLRAAWADGAVAAVATYAGRPRNPVLLDRSVWADVAATAEGDSGARTWLRAHPEQVRAVPCDDTGSPDDIDTPADLRRVQSA